MLVTQSNVSHKFEMFVSHTKIHVSHTQTHVSHTDFYVSHKFNLGDTGTRTRGAERHEVLVYNNSNEIRYHLIQHELFSFSPPQCHHLYQVHSKEGGSIAHMFHNKSW